MPVLPAPNSRSMETLKQEIIHKTVRIKMKINQRISRRRFIKEGILWVGLAALFPHLKFSSRKNNLPGKKALYWNRLAG